MKGMGEEEVERERAGQNIRVRQQRGSLRSCLSGESLAPASDGGDTDFADRTNSEVCWVFYFYSTPLYSCTSVYVWYVYMAFKQIVHDIVRVSYRMVYELGFCVLVHTYCRAE